MKFVNIKTLRDFYNIPLTSQIFGDIIKLSKGQAVIYSFKKGKDEYIGRTINLQTRIKEHRYSPFIEKKRKDCTIFYNSVNKYGWEQFTFEVLEHFPSKQDLSREILINLMKKKESEYIKTLKPSLNIILSNYSWDNENKIGIKKADLRGIPRTDIVKSKISLSLSGITKTDETKNAISVSKGYPILAKCLTDNTEIKYSSLRKLEQMLQIKNTTVWYKWSI